MKLTLLALTSLLMHGCSSQHQENPIPGLEISEIAPTKKTAMAKQNLRHLAKVYQLDPLLFTHKIHVSSESGPFSHPSLTLNTRYAEHPNYLLSQWLHEEFHWWAALNQNKMKAAIRDLRKVYPAIPMESRPKVSLASYNHLIICQLEYEALIHYLGKGEADLIIQNFINKEKLHPWIYTQVLKKKFVIKKIIHKNGLLPPPLN